MVVVVLQNAAEELVLGVMDRLDDEFIVTGEIKEAAALPRRAKLGKDIFAGERDQVIGRVKCKRGTQMAEDPGRVVFELEIVLG